MLFRQVHSVTTLPRHAQLPPKPAPELKRAHTPLRLSQFEMELVNHPDKAWTMAAWSIT